jgi:hypothetical protein
MKVQNMSEPITTGAAGAIGWAKIGGLAGVSGIGAGLATYVVMTMTKPKTDQEWHVALITTIIGSICGGPALISYMGWQNWANDVFGLMGIIGVCFACGLPSWLIVRALFAYIEKKRGADITEIIADGAQAAKAVKDAL